MVSHACVQWYIEESERACVFTRMMLVPRLRQLAPLSTMEPVTALEEERAATLAFVEKELGPCLTAELLEAMSMGRPPSSRSKESEGRPKSAAPTTGVRRLERITELAHAPWAPRAESMGSAGIRGVAVDLLAVSVAIFAVLMVRRTVNLLRP